MNDAFFVVCFSISSNRLRQSPSESSDHLTHYSWSPYNLIWGYVISAFKTVQLNIVSINQSGAWWRATASSYRDQPVYRVTRWELKVFIKTCGRIRGRAIQVVCWTFRDKVGYAVLLLTTSEPRYARLLGRASDVVTSWAAAELDSFVAIPNWYKVQGVGIDPTLQGIQRPEREAGPHLRRANQLGACSASALSSLLTCCLLHWAWCSCTADTRLLLLITLQLMRALVLSFVKYSPFRKKFQVKVFLYTCNSLHDELVFLRCGFGYKIRSDVGPLRAKIKLCWTVTNQN
jgi:hypothetical protein